MDARNAWIKENALTKQIRELECERNFLAGENQRLRDLLQEAVHQVTSPAKRNMSRSIWIERVRKELE